KVNSLHRNTQILPINALGTVDFRQLHSILGRETRRASLPGGSPRQSTSVVVSGSPPISPPRCASPRRSVRGPGEAISAISGGRGGRGSSSPARAEVSPTGPRATDPTHSRQSGSRSTPRLPGLIETSGVAPLQETVSSSFAPPTCGETAAVRLRPCSGLVITLTRPPGNRRKTTKGRRPSSVSPNAMYRFLARSPDLVVTGEDLLHLFRSELVPFDMENVVIISFKAGNNHRTIA